MAYSQGAKKDFLILGAASAIIQVLKSEEIKKDVDLLKLSNKSHKINKKIMELLNELETKLHTTQEEFYTNADNTKVLAEWVKLKFDLVFMKGGTILNENTNLILAVNQLLFMNFCERDKKLHKNFEWLAEQDQHFKLFDLLMQTNAKDVEEISFTDAVRLIQKIKG